MTWIEQLTESIGDVPPDRELESDVDALYAFHSAVSAAVRSTEGNSSPSGPGGRIESFEILADAMSTGSFDRHLRFPIDSGVARSAIDAEQRISGDTGALAPMCESAARILEGYIPADESELRSFLDDWSGQTALLAARASGVRGSWQRAGVLSAARAQTLAKHLCRIEQDSAAGIVLFPKSDLDRFGIDAERISDASTAGTDRLVWKQVIRIQQALSGVVDLVADLDRKPARRMRRWWFTVIELTHALEKLDYRVAGLPKGPSRMQRAQIAFQSLFGRTTFRG